MDMIVKYFALKVDDKWIDKYAKKMRVNLKAKGHDFSS